jgi:hypothetical protein
MCNPFNGQWSFSGVSGAFCSADPGTTNFLKIWYEYDEQETTGQVQFKGICCAMCPTYLVAPPVGLERAEALRTNESFGQAVHFPHPSRQDEWLNYLHLPVSELAGGALLGEGREGRRFLTARAVEVYAADVCWWHNERPTSLVDGSLGNHLAATNAWWLSSAPQYSVILWQPGIGNYHLITANSADSPQLVFLDPSRLVQVQVNDLRTSSAYADNTGGLRLSLRVLER